MVRKRKRIPGKIEAEVLFKNDRTCCICRDSAKGIQIHHIDGNPEHNSIGNLAVVCIAHHDEIHKSGGLTKRFTPQLIKKYKEEWETHIFKRRTNGYSSLKSESGIEKTLFEFEIRKIAFELAALDDKDKEEIKRRLEFYHTIFLLEGYTQRILDAIRQIVVLPALSDSNKSYLIAEAIHGYFVHLPGPEYVKIRNKDISNMELARDILRIIGEFSAEFNRSTKAIQGVSFSLEWFFDIAIKYDKEKLAAELLDDIRQILKSCKKKDDDGTKFEEGITRYTKLKKRLVKRIQNERPDWTISTKK